MRCAQDCQVPSENLVAFLGIKTHRLWTDEAHFGPDCRPMPYDTGVGRRESARTAQSARLDVGGTRRESREALHLTPIEKGTRRVWARGLQHRSPLPVVRVH